MRKQLDARDRSRRLLAQLNQRAAGRFGYRLARSPGRSTLAGELSWLLNRLEVDLVLDVGAHEGQFATLIRRNVGYSGEIWSFEPSEAAFNSLDARAAKDDRWHCHRVALGTTVGQAEFVEYSNSQMNSTRSLSSHVTTYMPGLREHARSHINLDTLGRFLEASSHQSVLFKTDTQGADLDVLAGTGSAIARIGAIVIEAPVVALYEGAPLISDIITTLADLGFELAGAFPIHHYDDGLRVIEFDCTFVNSVRFGGQRK